MRRADSLEKTLMLGKKDWGQEKGMTEEEKGMTEDEMVEWHHWLNGHGFGWTLGVGDGQGGLVCCSSWGHKESDMTEWLNWTESLSSYLWLLDYEPHFKVISLHFILRLYKIISLHFKVMVISFLLKMVSLPPTPNTLPVSCLKGKDLSATFLEAQWKKKA